MTVTNTWEKRKRIIAVTTLALLLILMGVAAVGVATEAIKNQQILLEVREQARLSACLAIEIAERHDVVVEELEPPGGCKEIRP